MVAILEESLQSASLNDMLSYEEVSINISKIGDGTQHILPSPVPVGTAE